MSKSSDKQNLSSPADPKKPTYFTLLTGATGGLGNAFAEELAKQNFNMLISGRNEKKLETLKEKLIKINPDISILTFPADLSKESDVQKLIFYIRDSKIEVERLINNAGAILEGSFENTPTTDLINCIKVNCIATSYLTKEIIGLRPADHTLEIITISSLAGNYALPYMAMYSATKAMLKSLMLALCFEYKNENIKFLLVQPGAIATSDSMKEAIHAQGLKGKLSSVPPSKIARKSLVLCKTRKNVYIPGFFNKLTNAVSCLVPQGLRTKVAGKMWKKSIDKRNIK